MGLGKIVKKSYYHMHTCCAVFQKVHELSANLTCSKVSFVREWVCGEGAIMTVLQVLDIPSCGQDNKAFNQDVLNYPTDVFLLWDAL